MEAQPKQGYSPSEAAPARPQVVLHVKPKLGSHPTEWSVGYDEDPPQGHKAEVYLPKGSGAHDIVFHLVGAGPDIKFDTADPLWVCKGRKCPDTSSKDPQVEVDQGQSTGKKLVIKDKNEGNACILSYQLNFIGADPCDPMIRNGGEI